MNSKEQIKLNAPAWRPVFAPQVHASMFTETELTVKKYAAKDAVAAARVLLADSRAPLVLDLERFTAYYVDQNEPITLFELNRIQTKLLCECGYYIN